LLPPLISAIAASILLALIIVKARHNTASRIFSLNVFAVFLWALFIFFMRNSPNVEHALLWEKALIPVIFLFFASFYHFSLAITNTLGNKLVLKITYFCGIPIIATSFTPWFFKEVVEESYGYAPVFGPAGYIIFGLASALLMMAFHSLIRAHRNSIEYEEKNRYLFVFLAMLFPLIGLLIDVFPMIYPASIFGNMGFCILASIAIFRYHLFDVRIALQKGFRYLMVSGFVAIPYVTILFLVSGPLKPDKGSFLIHAAFVLALAFAIQPLWRVAQGIVDRVFYRGRYDHLKTLERFSQECTEIINLTKLSERLISITTAAMRASSAHLMIFERNGLKYIDISNLSNDEETALQFDADSAFVTWFRKHDWPLSRAKIDYSSELASVTARERAMLDATSADLLVPFKRGADLIGILIMGEKLSGEPYGNDDIAMLMVLARHASTAIENAYLYDQSIRTEHALRESEEKYRSLVEGMQDGIFIARDGRLLFANDAFTRIIGRTTGEIIGMEFHKFVAPEDQDKIDLQILQSEAQNGGPRDYELRMLHKDRKTHVYVNTTICGFNYEGHFALMGTVKDITERKRADEAAARAKALEELDSLRTALLASVSHELRTPLTCIKGIASSLVQPDVEWDKETQQDFLNTINRESDALNHIVNDLMQMSQMEAGIMRMNKTECSISIILNNIREQLKYLTCDHNFQTNILPDIPLIYADEIRIGEVVTNLVSNSVAYSDKGTSIKLEAYNHNNAVTITITDEGIGIPSDHLDKVFDRFYRLESGVARRRGGTGLGLSICKGIIEAHNGSIWVESAIGKGSKFSFSLPFPAGSRINPSKQSPPLNTGNGEKTPFS